VYVQSLRLSKIGISATTKLKEVVGMLDGDGAAGFNPGSALMQAGLKIFATVGVTLAEVDHAPITIDALELPRKGKDHFTTQQALVAELTAHLVHQALLCSFKILGSNPNFGNPVALLDSTFDGIKDFGQGLARLGLVKYITRTDHSEALIVRGTGYDPRRASRTGTCWAWARARSPSARTSRAVCFDKF
jgi:hypothetical protein